MTSAIPQMTVAEVRKALGEVRKRAAAQTPTHPFFISSMLTDTLSIQDFCLKFVCGHHDKRHNKGKKSSLERDQKEEPEEEQEDTDDMETDEV